MKPADAPPARSARPGSHLPVDPSPRRLQRGPQRRGALHVEGDQPGGVPLPRAAGAADAAAQTHQRAGALLPAHGAVPAAARHRAAGQPAGTCQYAPPSSYSSSAPPTGACWCCPVEARAGYLEVSLLCDRPG